jgi:hypothetical protein
MKLKLLIYFFTYFVCIINATNINDDDGNMFHIL